MLLHLAATSGCIEEVQSSDCILCPVGRASVRCQQPADDEWGTAGPRRHSPAHNNCVHWHYHRFLTLCLMIVYHCAYEMLPNLTHRLIPSVIASPTSIAVTSRLYRVQVYGCNCILLITVLVVFWVMHCIDQVGYGSSSKVQAWFFSCTALFW